MSITHELTRRADGKRVLTITMDTDDDALLLTAAAGAVSIERIRETAQMMPAEARNKIGIMLDRPGWAAPLYPAFDKLMTALRIKWCLTCYNAVSVGKSLSTAT